MPVLALEKQDGGIDVGLVSRLVYVANARRCASFDLVLQAWPRAIFEVTVLALPNQE